jgi:hypothetical protein
MPYDLMTPSLKWSAHINCLYTRTSSFKRSSFYLEDEGKMFLGYAATCLSPDMVIYPSRECYLSISWYGNISLERVLSISWYGNISLERVLPVCLLIWQYIPGQSTIFGHRYKKLGSYIRDMEVQAEIRNHRKPGRDICSLRLPRTWGEGAEGWQNRGRPFLLLQCTTFSWLAYRHNGRNLTNASLFNTLVQYSACLLFQRTQKATASLTQ